MKYWFVNRDLVGGFNPFEKYDRQNGFIFPKFRGESKKYLSCHQLDKALLNPYFLGYDTGRYFDLPWFMISNFEVYAPKQKQCGKKSPVCPGNISQKSQGKKSNHNVTLFLAYFEDDVSWLKQVYFHVDIENQNYQLFWNPQILGTFHFKYIPNWDPQTSPVLRTTKKLQRCFDDNLPALSLAINKSKTTVPWKKGKSSSIVPWEGHVTCEEGNLPTVDESCCEKDPYC